MSLDRLAFSRFWFPLVLLFAPWLCIASGDTPIEITNVPSSQPTVLIVVGAPGEPEYSTNFSRQVRLWTEACTRARRRAVVIGSEPAEGTNDYQTLNVFLTEETKHGSGELWLVLIGHGTFDGKEARFNLRGPDLSATELAAWLQPIRLPVVLINTASSSAPFLMKCSATNRVVITATRSGNEQNFTRFGGYFAESVDSSEADLDKDGQTSLLEAFLTASRQVTEFYKIEGRLATEHPLLDDNGDGKGTPADWFQGLRAVKKPKDAALVDGLLARQWHLVPGSVAKALTPKQLVERDSLERAVLLHREKKSQIPEEEYYRGLESLLLELAHFYQTNSIMGEPGVK